MAVAVVVLVEIVVVVMAATVVVLQHDTDTGDVDDDDDDDDDDDEEIAAVDGSMVAEIVVDSVDAASDADVEDEMAGVLLFEVRFSSFVELLLCCVRLWLGTRFFVAPTPFGDLGE